jgi:hypothetical protein
MRRLASPTPSLHAALVDFGFGAVAPDPLKLAKAGPKWVLGCAPKRIDILTKLGGVTFRRACARRIHVRLDDRRRVPIIGREDLLGAKLASGRPQDLADAATIREFMADEKMHRRKRKNG